MGFMDNLMNKLASNAKETMMTDAEIIANEYLEFNSSIQRQWMATGEKYYTGENDIKDLVIEKGAIRKADTKLAHSHMKLLVDEKINYMLAKDYSLMSDDETFLKAVKKALGKRFNYTLTRLGYEASNKGIGWLQAYLDPSGQLKFMVIPSEQCCPIWSSNSHDELEAMIRYYNIIEYEGTVCKTITKLEYWTANGLEFYEYRNDKLILDIDAYMKYGRDQGGPIPHYSKNGEDKYWGKVPFIPFKNNHIEFPDVRFTKTLIDNYDLSRSEIANFVQDVKNLVYVLKGYGGENLAEFMENIRKYNAVKVDDDAEGTGGIDTINPTMDITAAKEHYEQLARDIDKFGQSIPKDIEKLGNSPSGTALKFHYSAIDLKCNAMESEFKFGFEALLYFIKLYTFESGKGNFGDADCDIIFNRDVAINESAAIADCIASQDLLSEDTLLANHPWVNDIEVEKKRLEEKRSNIAFITPLNVHKSEN